MSAQIRTLRLSAAALLTLPLVIPGQTPDNPERPSFEVSSVKPTQGQQMNSGFRRASPGALNATNVTVKMLIEYAYDVRDDQISGGPSWLETDRYEVVAKPSENAGGNASTVKLRTQSLLADRFHLALHRQTKEMPILALKVGKNGPKGLKESSAPNMDFFSNGHHLGANRVSMDVLARRFLAPQLRRTVLDRTGISGEFDFTLDWAPDDAPSGETAANQFPPLLTALQEQLGLKLEQERGPVETLVIDHAERPAAN